MNEKHKKVTNIMSSILVGLAGSCLWEFLFSPMFHSVGAYLLSVPAKISSTFGNWYVSSIASADREYAVIEIRTWIFVFLACYLLGLNIKKLFSTYPLFLKVLLLCFLFFDLFFDLQTSNTAHKTLQNIEIVSPYISVQEYQLLKSNFYSMTTMDDFKSLNQEIKTIATEHSLQLH